MLNTQQTLRVTELMYDLGWDETDDVVIEVGGTVISGIHQPEDANPRWSRDYGTRGYNNDSFIVIKNKSRTPFVPSKPESNEKA